MPSSFRADGHQVVGAGAALNLSALINPEGNIGRVLEVFSACYTHLPQDETSNGGAVDLYKTVESPAGASRTFVVRVPAPQAPRRNAGDLRMPVAGSAILANPNSADGAAASSIPADVTTDQARRVARGIGNFGTSTATVFGSGNVTRIELLEPVILDPTTGIYIASQLLGPGEMLVMRALAPSAGDLFQPAWCFREWTWDELERAVRGGESCP